MQSSIPETTASRAPELACPHCHGALDGEPVKMRCARHGLVGERSSDGVFVFDRDTAYWGEVPREHMQCVNAAARAHGWRAALEQQLRPHHPGLMDYVQHPARADWRVLLPLDRARTVAVDVGAGWGANSFGVAPHVRRIYAVEKIAERIEFVGLRARQDGCANLVPVRADLHALPFAPGSIDVFAVNGVLEWVGLVDPEAGPGRRARNPRQLQERFLRQLAEFLRPGGMLYVGIENRYGRMCWQGVPDLQGLRFSSLMPRPLARAYTWLRAATSPRTYHSERDYRTYTYSYDDYRKLLESCGFEDVQRYSVMPGYNTPAVLVPLTHPGPLVWLATRSRSQNRLRGAAKRAIKVALANSGLEARIASTYALVARRS